MKTKTNPTDAIETSPLTDLPADAPIGQWSQRMIGVLRSLQAASFAMEGIAFMPEEIADGTLEKQLQSAIAAAQDLAGQAVLRMLAYADPVQAVETIAA